MGIKTKAIIAGVVIGVCYVVFVQDADAATKFHMKKHKAEAQEVQAESSFSIEGVIAHDQEEQDWRAFRRDRDAKAAEWRHNNRDPGERLCGFLTGGLLCQ